MSPADAIELVQRDGVYAPSWIGPHDHPWITALLDEFVRFAGRPVREWRARAKEPLRCPCPEGKRRLVTAALERLGEPAAAPERPSPAELRELVFGAAQRERDAGAFDAERVVSGVAERVGLARDHVVERLYGDLPDERRLTIPPALPEASHLGLLTNQASAQALLRRASSVVLELGGQTRPVLRQIALKRLLCTVRPAAEGVVVEVSGPFALFRRTTLYGRALASLVPVLRRAERFTITARCVFQGREVNLRIGTGDPIFPPGDPPRPFDSKLEERFAREFAKLAPDWDVVREPEPVAVGGTWVFPDFALVHRRDTRRRWLLEIVGFWTADYLNAKLDRLRRAERRDLVVCVDAELGCGEDALAELQVVPFRRRVDAAAVLRRIEASHPGMVPSKPPARAPLRIEVRDLFIDYAGRRPITDPIHERLRKLQRGVPVRLVPRDDYVFIDVDGGPIAALSGRAKERWSPMLAGVQEARVVEVVDRSAEQSAAAWRERLRVGRWRVPVVEVVVVTLQTGSGA